MCPVLNLKLLLSDDRYQAQLRRDSLIDGLAVQYTELLRCTVRHSDKFVIKGETVAFSPDGQILVSGNDDGIIEI